jgi:hypothetical protein
MTAEDPDSVLYALMQIEEQLAYAHARCSVLIREILYGSE